VRIRKDRRTDTKNHDRTRWNTFLAWAPWLAVAASLALRAAYFEQILDNPYFDTPVMDEGYHDRWAAQIAAGDLTGQIPFFRAPLYPFLLGLAYALRGGPDFALIRGAQLLLGAVTPLLVWAIARRLLPERRGLAAAAAFVSALDGVLVYFEAELLLESLLAPISALLVLLVLRAQETGAARRWLAAGLVMGVFAITRPNILLVAPVLFVVALGWRVSRGFERPLRPGAAAALTAGTCALVLPITAINTFVGGDPVLIASQGGLNFFLGNNAVANGWSATAPTVFRVDWFGGVEDAQRLAEEGVGRPLEPSEVSDYWYDRAFEWWREHPVDGVVLTLKKAVLLLSGKEYGNNRDLYFFFDEFAPIGLPFAYLLYVLTPLALVGAVSFWRRGDPAARTVILYAAVYSVSVVMFFVTARYRVPLRPLVAILAVQGAWTLFDGVRAHRWRGAAAVAAVAVLAVALNANAWAREYRVPIAQFHQSVSTTYYTRGDRAEALRWQELTLEEDPDYPSANLNLGTIYLEMGRAAEAVAAFRRELEISPDDGETLVSLAQALNDLGRVDEAERAYAAAEAAGFEDARALFNHGVVLERLDRPLPEIEALYRRSAEMDSTFVEAWNNLGVVLARQGRVEEAVPLWEHVVEVRPGHARALDNLARARRKLEEHEASSDSRNGGSTDP
jgi:Flp pilus assembly protein TadD